MNSMPAEGVAMSGAARPLSAGMGGELQQALQAMLRRSRPDAGSLTLRRLVSARSSSRVFYGEGSAYPCPVAVKQCLDAKTGLPAPEAARTYFQALERVGAGQDDGAFAIARPFDLFEELGVVVAQWVSGPTLSRWILQSSPEEARRAAENAGRWLAELHRRQGLPAVPMETGPMLSRLDIVLARGAETAQRRIVSKAADRLRQTAGKAGARPVAWTRIHGDFKPDNLIVSEGRLVGIDLDLLYTDTVNVDLAHFLNHLAMLFYTPRGLPHFRRAKPVAEAFRNGYEQGRGVAISPFELTWVRLHNALRLLLNHAGRSRPLRLRLTAWSLLRLTAELSDWLGAIDKAFT